MKNSQAIGSQWLGCFFLFLFARPRGRLALHARGHAESGGDGSEYGDYDVQDFTPKVFVWHSFNF